VWTVAFSTGFVDCFAVASACGGDLDIRDSNGTRRWRETRKSDGCPSAAAAPVTMRHLPSSGKLPAPLA